MLARGWSYLSYGLKERPGRGSAASGKHAESYIARVARLQNPIVTPAQGRGDGF